jgi:hypothetical protein
MNHCHPVQKNLNKIFKDVVIGSDSEEKLDFNVKP